MDSIGERLRLERLRQGRELEQVAQQTRINSRHLEAIENDDLGNVPGKFFYRSFVRQYARALGLDEGELANEFPEALKREERTEEPFGERPGREQIDVPPMPAAGRGRSNSSALPVSLILLVAVILAASGVYSLYQRMQNPSVAAPVAAEAPPPPPVLEPQPSEPVAAVAVPPQTSETGLASAALPSAVPGTTPPPGTPGFEPVQPAPPGSGVLQILATGEVWVSVSSGGNTILSRTLQPNDTRTITVPHGARMVLGNAGGADIRWNGQPVPQLGPAGQVRSVVLGPDGPRGQAPPPSVAGDAGTTPAAPRTTQPPKLVPTAPEM
jgi:cytoskeleton protein RodZ